MSRLLCVCATVLILAAPSIVGAGAGDPRLVNGVLEWPAIVTNEAFLIVRGDDGVLYYVGIAAARREGAVTAGSRVSVLGLEGRSPHEITAVGVGSGPNAEAALAQLQSARSAASTAPAPAGPPSAAPAMPAPVSPAVATPAPAGPVHAPATEGATPAAPNATAPPAPAPRQPVAPSAKSVTTDARNSGGGVAPAVVPASTATASEVAAAKMKNVTTPAMLLPNDDQRWVELVGEVESLVGRTLVLRVDGGRVSVDVSNLRANLDRIVERGSTVKVYGVPVEMRFKAMGFIDPDARTHGPRSN